jgi:aerobic carbon-monoxide dehydrogenase medium subunit
VSGGLAIHRPDTLEEALETLAGGDDDVRILGGGTGLTLLIRYGFFVPTTLVSLQRIASSHAAIELLPDGRTRIGGMATLRDLERDAGLVSRYPLLAQALGRLASVRVRNVAQLGGAIAHGHPQMDVPPVLLALGAEVEVRSRRGARTLASDDLFLGYYETAVERDEVITSVVLPTAQGLRSTYHKVTARLHDDWPALGVAVALHVEDGAIAAPRVAVGAIADRPQRVDAAEEALSGASVGDVDLREVAESAAETLDLHDGPAGSADYQRQLLAVHLRRALESVVGPDADAEVR